jgi:uncharacterized protein (DUF433 family)
MKTEAFNQQLEAGLYTLADIAFLLNLPKGKVRRWMKDFWDTKFGEAYQNKYSWGEGRDKATNFYMLIEFYVFYQLRELKVSTHRIIVAHQDMAEQMKTPYPFASSKLFTDGKNVLFTHHDGTIIEADKSRQAAFEEIIEDFCKKISFSYTTQMAENFYPLGTDKHIVVNPHHQFGQPVVSKTNILAETLYNLFKAGEDIEFLSRLYQLEESEVADAISLFNNKTAA